MPNHRLDIVIMIMVGMLIAKRLYFRTGFGVGWIRGVAEVKHIVTVCTVLHITLILFIFLFALFVLAQIANIVFC